MDDQDKELVDDDYTLTEGAAWLEVRGFAIRIWTTSEGVKVDVYKSESEMQNSLANTEAYFHQLEEEGT